MKNKKRRETDDYRLLKNKLLARTLFMMVIASVIIFSLYIFVLRGNFANWMIGFLERFVFDNYVQPYDEAWYFYVETFRKYMEIFFGVAIMVVFIIVFRIFSNNFAKYFREINRGIDALINEDAGEVILSAELVSTEKKINAIKHTLQKRKLDTQLAEQRKNDLIVYLAHDLKTPLTSVIGYLTLLRDEGQISDELRQKYLSISLDKAERLEDLINEFFEITRFNLSNITLEYSRVNLTRMLEQLIYEFKPMFVDKNLKCSLKATPSMMIKCDVNKLQRVFDNLLRNAVNYSLNDTSIEVTAKQNDNYIILEFTNQGNTIPEEKLERIFEQFYRLDSSRSSSGGGAGLGLAIAKEIVELHNGIITANSEDGLTSFKVSIPIL